MCQAMTMNVSFWNNVWANFYLPKFNEFSELKPLYYLTAYYRGDKIYENKVNKILYNKSFRPKLFNITISNTEIVSKFREILSSINMDIGIKFNVDHYTEVTTADILELEIEKCESMMDEFEKQKQDLSECIKEFRIKTEKMEEECDDAVQASKDLNSKTVETLESNTKMFETLAASSSRIEELLKARKKSNENNSQ